MTKRVYISIGSNKGERFQHLQHAVNRIFENIGTIEFISKVYTSPAFGFESDEFLNACLVVKTDLLPETVMKTLLDIEAELGRTRTDSNGYEARVIDLDIIFIDDDIIETTLLQVPHPEMHKRRFVLQPLNDVAPRVVHPVFKQLVCELLQSCTDDSVLQPINECLKNPIERFNFSHHNYIAIEGNIGAGKTSLSTKMSEDFNAKLVLERFADNPFLPKFYEDASRYAFPLEMSFLADRYQQISDDLSQLDLFKDFIVSDYDVFKSLIFSRITLEEDEFKLYRKLFYIMYKEIAKPDLYVYLYQNTERLQQNIKKRGRQYEQQIADDYLNKINLGYLEFLKNQKDFKVKIIDISNKDFVNNRADYLWVLGEISNEFSTN
ncbi:2-amino-4-hydroxy-6-hydroxymethyldihydropteridine diphosphokinase [Formosa haliotis]|uniref:2-amino-4-hydroxy-6- hydroxymethyldihydropteridine diphosphokinase n=1 Tax=Formosa haliotis TaxID=1555194 RepID=UPI0008269030|nr:2-amino-4-hydroxy-6-hydroxymethyldihydropteridine diphosphokinase [Formosa haliotis]